MDEMTNDATSYSPPPAQCPLLVYRAVKKLLKMGVETVNVPSEMETTLSQL